jgi:hypothetical protein
MYMIIVMDVSIQLQQDIIGVQNNNVVVKIQQFMDLPRENDMTQFLDWVLPILDEYYTL